jgi:hypothetical protein
MKLLKSLLIYLLIFFPLSGFAQLDQIERKYLLLYYELNPEYKYKDIVKLIDNANPEQLKKFSQCAQSVLSIRAADEIIRSDNLWFAMFFMRTYIKDENKLKKFLLELDPLYESINIPIEKTNPHKGDTTYKIFKSLNITANKSLDQYIQDRKSGRLKYDKKTEILGMEGVDLFEYYTILSSAYPNESSGLENTINNSPNFTKEKISYINYIQWYETMYIKYVFELMKNTAENKKKYAENDMVFCDRMMLAELEKIKQNTEDYSRFSGPWYSKDPYGDGYYEWSFNITGEKSSGKQIVTSKSRTDNWDLKVNKIEGNILIGEGTNENYVCKDCVIKTGKRYSTFEATLIPGKTEQEDILKVHSFETKKSEVYPNRDWGTTIFTRDKK